MKFNVVLLCFLLIVFAVQMAKSKSGKNKQLILQSKETNVVNFVRLVVMRLVFGVASTMGLAESLSGVLGGIFVPPGTDEYDDYGGDEDYGGEFLRK